MITSRAGLVAQRAIPAGSTATTGAIDGGAGMVVFTDTTAGGRRQKQSAGAQEHLNKRGYLIFHRPQFTTHAVLPSITELVAEHTLVPGVAQALPAGRVAAAVFMVAVASAVTVRPPPARLAVTHSGTLITR